MLQRFWNGMQYVPHAWKLCGSIGIRWMLFIPIIVNISLGFLLLRYGLTGEVSRRIVDSLAQNASPGIMVFVALLARFLDVVVFILVTYTAVRFGTVIASPLYGAIAERVCDTLLPDQDLPSRSWWGDVTAAIGYEIKKIGLNIGFAIITLILSLVPVVGVIIDVGWTIGIAMIFVCLDVTDASYSRRGQTFRQRAAELKHVLPEAIGFVVVALPMVSVPVVNMFTVPWCCAAGMFLATEAHKRASIR